jgi:hypothetical protein
MSRQTRRVRPRKHVHIVEVETTDVAELAGEALPVRSLKLNLGSDRKAFVFTMSRAARERMDAEKLRSIAQVLGDLVHPHSATLVIADETDLRCWEVSVGLGSEVVRVNSQELGATPAWSAPEEDT